MPKLITTPTAYDRRRLRMLAEQCRGKSVLDVGCAQLPNPYFRADQNVVGLDIHPARPAGRYIEHLTGDICTQDVLGERRFDTIVLGEVIEHVQCPHTLLRRLGPHLANDGLLILSTPNPLGFPVVLCEYLCTRRFFYTHEHEYYFAPRWLWRLLEHSGYSVDRTIGCGVSIMGLPVPAPAACSYTVIYTAQYVSR